MNRFITALIAVFIIVFAHQSISQQSLLDPEMTVHDLFGMEPRNFREGILGRVVLPRPFGSVESRSLKVFRRPPTTIPMKRSYCYSKEASERSAATMSLSCSRENSFLSPRMSSITTWHWKIP